MAKATKEESNAAYHERKKELLATARLEFGTAYLIVRAIIGLRILLFASTVTGLGVLMNTYKPANIVPAIMTFGGAPFVGTVAAPKPNQILIVLSVFVLALIVGTIVGLDVIAGKLQGRYIKSGSSIESSLGGRLRFFSALIEIDNEIRVGFIMARTIVICVALLWMINFLLGIL